MILINYIFFALLATGVNLMSQFLYVEFSPFNFLKKLIAIFIGTLTGLIFKYILDKVYIFKVEIKSKNEEVKTFILYSLMGVFTTIIFWFFEYSFIMLFPESPNAMYFGGFIGLGIGYIIKYFLDKKYVFTKSKN
ncbi:MAG: polysaccharide biosynthesis protein GtrA [Candidatus Cloacimonadota bacterium]|nr:MAG: polysaccharide biosynthesis protein GtrA [Candidatus Cloacimonadota bacterium]